MDRAQTGTLATQRNTILGLLLALAAAAWALLLAWRGSDPGMGMAMASPTMGLRAPLFLAIWVTMMVAMMFPAAAPMVLTFHRVQAGRRERGGAFVPTWVFVAGYLLVWSLAGAAAYLAASAAEAAALEAIFGGAEGGPMAAFAPLVGKHLGVRRVPIPTPSRARPARRRSPA